MLVFLLLQWSEYDQTSGTLSNSQCCVESTRNHVQIVLKRNWKSLRVRFLECLCIVQEMPRLWMLPSQISIRTWRSSYTLWSKKLGPKNMKIGKSVNVCKANVHCTHADSIWSKVPASCWWLTVRCCRERLEEELHARLKRDEDKLALEGRINRLTRLILHSTRNQEASCMPPSNLRSRSFDVSFGMPVNLQLTRRGHCPGGAMLDSFGRINSKIE